MTLHTLKIFALIGAAGHIASRHTKANRVTGNRIVSALDKSEAVGILDGYFFDVAFFTESERFDRYAGKLRRQGGDEQAHPFLQHLLSILVA